MLGRPSEEHPDVRRRMLENHRLWALTYYYTALEIALLLRLQAHFGLQQKSMCLPQQGRV